MSDNVVDLFGSEDPELSEDMERNTSETGLLATPPFVWPEQRILAGMIKYQTSPPFAHLFSDALGACGLVTDVDHEGVKFLSDLMEKHEDLLVSLILLLYPACATTASDLNDLDRLMDKMEGRLSIRLHLLVQLNDTPNQTIMVNLGAGKKPVLITGPNNNFGLQENRADRINLAATLDASTTESWVRWFNWLWATGTCKFRPESVDIPTLVRPEGTIEAQRMWEGYMADCVAVDVDAVKVTVDPETGDVVAAVEDDKLEGLTDEEKKEVIEEEQKKLPTVAIHLPKLDQFADDIARLFELGQIATIDKSTRIKPLSATLSARLFGEAAERVAGHIKRKTNYSISIFDPAEQKQIENIRTSIRDVLNNFSYPLADGLRWVPHSAQELMNREIECRNNQGTGLLSKLVGGSVDSYLKKIEECIRSDANTMYRDMIGNKDTSISDDAFHKIMKEIRKRLDGALDGNLIPQLGYNPIGFSITGNTSNASEWGMAYRLLQAIAKYPIDVAGQGQYFLRGFKLDLTKQDIINTMNVLGHPLISDQQLLEDYQSAKEKLKLFEDLDEASIEIRDKCKLLYNFTQKGDWSILSAADSNQE